MKENRDQLQNDWYTWSDFVFTCYISLVLDPLDFLPQSKYFSNDVVCFYSSTTRTFVSSCCPYCGCKKLLQLATFLSHLEFIFTMLYALSEKDMLDSFFTFLFLFFSIKFFGAVFSMYFDILIKDLMPLYICKFCLNITWSLEWCRTLVFKENKYKMKPWLLLFCYNELDMCTSVYLIRLQFFQC